MSSGVKMGNGAYRDVSCWSDCVDLLRDEGIEVERVAEQTLMRRDWTGEVRESSGVHVYFENSDGDEVAYYTPSLETLFVFDVPRKVHESMRARKTLWSRGVVP